MSRQSLYGQLYDEIKQDILSGRLADGTKLPSKRAQAERSGVSVVTVETAYAQLAAEGYITARERSGYYVCAGEMPPAVPQIQPEPEDIAEESVQESTAGGSGLFPFSVWTRLMRTVILEKGNALLSPVPSGGAPELQRAVSDYLKSFRGISVPPHRIIVGAGTEYLNNVLVQLLGVNLTYAVENPGYHKPSRIYRLNGALCLPVGLDEQGICASQLYYNNVDVAHISPAHHFPTGTVMPVSRRLELLKWAVQRNGYIIEDDYDSEFRWVGRPVPTLFGLDNSGRVIYMNTFSMTIAPSVRIGYICLPPELYELWRQRMSFCSCPVPAFEQYTLARFISDGHFERHINRMRKHHRRIREIVIQLAVKYAGAENVSEDEAGLHFIVRMSADDPLKQIYESCGVRVTPLSAYYDEGSEVPESALDKYVVNYSSADINSISEVLSE